MKGKNTGDDEEEPMLDDDDRHDLHNLHRNDSMDELDVQEPQTNKHISISDEDKAH